MSNELLNLVWPLRIGSAAEKAVLVTLADACGAADACSMVADTIAYRTDYTARAVKNFLHGLEAKGLIVICERPGRASEFWVNRSALEAWDKAPTWLKNQQLKIERAEKLKARAPARPAPPPPRMPEEGTVAWLAVMGERLNVPAQGDLEGVATWADRVRRAIAAANILKV